MASIYKRGNIWWADYLNASQHRQQTSLNTDDETLARQLCRRMTARENEIRGSRITVETFATKWIAERRAMGGRDARNEEQRLRDHVLPVLGDIPLSTLRASDLRDWAIGIRTAGNVAPKTLRNIYGVLRTMIRSAKVAGLVEMDPCILTKAELGKNKDKDPAWRATAIFSKAELVALCTSLQVPGDRQIVNALAALAGLRQGEVCALRWSDIQHREPVSALMISRSHKGPTKTESTRQVPVHPVLAARLEKWRQSGWRELMGRSPTGKDLVVPTGKTSRGRAGRMRTMSIVYKGWRKDLDALGMRARRYHDLRRTFISLALADGARRDVLERVTHQALATRAIDLYTTLPWEVLCSEVLKLQIDLEAAREEQTALIGNCDNSVVLQSSYSGSQPPVLSGTNSGGGGSRTLGGPQ